MFCASKTQQKHNLENVSYISFNVEFLIYVEKRDFRYMFSIES